jgi:hypothetical protein
VLRMLAMTRDNHTESRNEARLNEIRDEILEAEGVDTSDEAKAKRHRDYEARQTAEICGECGGTLGPDATIYRLRFFREGGIYPSYPTRVLCEECASRPRKPRFSLNSVVRAQQLSKKHGLSFEDAYQQVITRKLVYDYCETCDRKVVWEESKRDRRGGGRLYVFCSERYARDIYRQIRNARNAEAREKPCEVCGERFTATRRDAKTCSAACKQKAYRQRKAHSES